MTERAQEDNFWLDVYVYEDFSSAMKAHDKLKEAIIRGLVKGVFHHSSIKTEGSSKHQQAIALYSYNPPLPDHVVNANNILNHDSGGQRLPNDQLPQDLVRFAKRRAK